MATRSGTWFICPVLERTLHYASTQRAIATGAHESRLQWPTVPPWVGAVLLSALVTLPGHPVAAESETADDGQPVVTIAADVNEVVYNLDRDMFALADPSFTVSRTGPTLAAAEVPLILTQDRSFLPAGALSRTVTIAAGATSASLEIAQTEFTRTAREDGTLTAEVGEGDGYTGAAATASVAMRYVEWAVIAQIESSEYRFPEDHGAAQFTMILTTATGVPPPNRSLWFSLSSEADEATSPDDYKPLSETKGITPGSWNEEGDHYTARNIFDEMLIHDDAIDEPDERLSVLLMPMPGSPQWLGFAMPDGKRCASPFGDRCLSTVTIEDNDTRGITVTPTALTVPEGDARTYTVVLATKPTGKVTVTPSVSGSPEVSTGPATLTFTQHNWGETQAVTVAADDDTVAQAITASVTHDVDGGDYASEPADAVAVTVTDDETPSTAIALAVNPQAVGEAAATTEVELTASLNHAPAAAETEVTIAVSGDSAAASDFMAVSSFNLTIGARASSGTVTFSFSPDDDKVDEEDEAVSVVGSSGGFTVTAATLTITDDDTRGIEVSPTALTVAEGSQEAYTVVLTSEPTAPVEVTVTVPPSAPFSIDEAVLTFTAGTWNQEQTVAVTAESDEDAVSPPVATVTLEAGGADYDGVAGSVTVQVEDSTPVIKSVLTLAVEPSVVAEDVASQLITVMGTLQPAPAAAVEVEVSVSGDTATVGADFAAVTDFMLTYAAGQATASNSFTLEPVDDGVPEGTERLKMVGTPGDPNIAAAEAVVEISNAEPSPPHLPTVSITPAAEEVVEGGEASFIVTRSGTAVAALTVAVDIADQGGVVAGAAPTDVTFASGKVTATLAIATADDNTDEPDGAVSATLATGVGYVLGSPARVTVTVADNDAAPALTIADVRALESGGKIEFTAMLAAASGHEVSVGCTQEDMTATAGEDYQAQRGTLVFAPGQTSVTITVPVMDDLLDEADESFLMVLSDPSNATLEDSEATGTIVDDDPAVAKAWLARFGRTVASQVVETVAGRLAAGSERGTQVTVAGRQLNLMDESAAGGWRDLTWAALNGTADARTMEFAELLGDSSFNVKLADADGLAGSGGAYGGGGYWGAWGRGSVARLAGETAELNVRGQVAGGAAGVEYGSGRVLAGVSAAYFGGAGEVALPGTEASLPLTDEVASWLASVHPYVSMDLTDRLAVWALLGYGRGTMSLANAMGREETAIRMTMGAIGGRAGLLAPAQSGRIGLAVRTDGLLLQIASAETARLPGVTANVHRLRVVLEGAVVALRGPAGVFTPTLEVAARYDGGAAETGVGLEVGGGLSYAYPAWGVTAAASGRLLVTHEDHGFKEWGAGASLRVAPATTGLGPSLTLNTAWGDTATGQERLWSQGVELTGHSAATDARALRGRVAAELGYGIAHAAAGAMVTPFVGIAWQEGGSQAYRLGGRLHVGQSFRLDLEAEHHDGGAAPRHGLNLTATLTW